MKFVIIFWLTVSLLIYWETLGSNVEGKKYGYTITLQDGVTLKCSSYIKSDCGLSINGEYCAIEGKYCIINGEYCVINGGVPASTYACQTNVTIRKW